jgi:hypothetical protein
MSNEKSSSDWFFRVARGDVRGARFLGLAFFILSVALTPLIYIAFLNAHSTSGSGIAANFSSAVLCLVWLLFADDIRKFTNGDRLIDPLRSNSFHGVRHFATYPQNTFARWMTAVFSLSMQAVIGWLAYATAFS